MRSQKPPTAKLIARQVTALMRSIRHVYGDDGKWSAERTTEHGTLTLDWRDGRRVLDRVEDPPGTAEIELELRTYLAATFGKPFSETATYSRQFDADEIHRLAVRLAGAGQER